MHLYYSTMLILVGVMSSHGLQAEDAFHCENELLTPAQNAQIFGSQSRGVAEPQHRVPEDGKALLKNRVQKVLSQRKPPVRSQQGNSKIMAKQRRYLSQRREILRTHRGTEEELRQKLSREKKRLL